MPSKLFGAKKRKDTPEGWRNYEMKNFIICGSNKIFLLIRSWKRKCMCIYRDGNYKHNGDDDGKIAVWGPSHR